MNVPTEAHFRTVIIGGGPAGLAPLVAASRAGRLDTLLREGLAIVERGPRIGAGRLGGYAITSDSTAETFLAAVTGHADPRLSKLLDHPVCRELGRYGRGAVPLREAGHLMDVVGAVLGEAVERSAGALLTGHVAMQARLTECGHWALELQRSSDGALRRITAEKLLLATGGEQTLDRLAETRIAGRCIPTLGGDRLMLSDAVLQPDGLAGLRQRLGAARLPRVAILGGSTSALATAGMLLRDCGDLLHRPGSITILHRRPLRIFYPSAEAAHADGYRDFDGQDICPVSGFVYRLAGFRLDSRELVMSLLGVGGRPVEPRVVLHRIGDHASEETEGCLAAADVVVAAMGYQPRALPLHDVTGRTIPLRGILGLGSLVDAGCRVCDAHGRPVPNVWGVGLAAGFLPSGPLGGEPSFRGQANGLWLWQTAVGCMLVDAFLARSHPDAPQIRTEILQASRANQEPRVHLGAAFSPG